MQKTGMTLLLLSSLAAASASPGAAQSHHSRHSGNNAWRAQWQRQWLAAHSRQSKSSENLAAPVKPEAGKQNFAGAQPAASAATSPAHAPANAPTAPATAAVSSTGGSVTSVGKAAPAVSSPAPSLPAAPVLAPLPAMQQKPASPAVPVTKPAPTAPASLSAKPAAPANAVKPAAQSAALVSSAAPAAANAASPVPLNLAAHTRPDLFAPSGPAGAAPAPASGNSKTEAHTQDTPLSPVAGAWKMIAYLLPMLLVIVGCISLLKRFQTKTGRLPGALGSAARFGGSYAPSAPRGNTGVVKTLFAGLRLPQTRPKPRASIRLLESAPIGGASVHLLEVRGRVLLLGATPSSLSLLTEFAGREEESADEFQNMLHTAAADMDAMDYAQPDLPAAATVATLEDLLRETGQAVSQRSRRLRTVREVEGEDA